MPDFDAFDEIIAGIQRAAEHYRDPDAQRRSKELMKRGLTFTDYAEQINDDPIWVLAMAQVLAIAGIVPNHQVTTVFKAVTQTVIQLHAAWQAIDAERPKPVIAAWPVTPEEANDGS